MGPVTFSRDSVAAVCCAVALALATAGCVQPSRNIGHPVVPGERAATFEIGQTLAQGRHADNQYGAAGDERVTTASEGLGPLAPSVGYRWGLGDSVDVGVVAGLPHLGLNTRAMLWGQRGSKSLVVTADLRASPLGVYHVTGRLLWFSPLSESAQSSVLVGVGSSAGQFWHLTAFTTWDADDPNSDDAVWAQGTDYGSVQIREVRAHALLGASFWKQERRHEHVFYLQPTFIVAREQEPRHEYVPGPGVIVGYSGTYGSRL